MAILVPVQLAVSQSLYILFGACALISNSFIVYVIKTSKMLHFNAYYLAAALATTDIVGGFGFISTGSYRLHAIFTNQSSTLFPPWTCAYAPSCAFLTLSFNAGGMMVFLIACDRFLAIAAAKFYFGLGNRYTASLILFCFLYAFLAQSYYTYDLVVVVPQVPSVTKFCYGAHSEPVHLYDYYSQAAFISCSGLIMLTTMTILRRQQKRGVSIQNQQGGINRAQAISRARNIKASKLLALIFLNTFCMLLLPGVAVAIVDSFGRGPSSLFAQYMQFLMMLQPIHATVNFVIYFRKGSPFRVAFMKKNDSA